MKFLPFSWAEYPSWNCVRVFQRVSVRVYARQPPPAKPYIQRPAIIRFLFLWKWRISCVQLFVSFLVLLSFIFSSCLQTSKYIFIKLLYLVYAAHAAIDGFSFLLRHFQWTKHITFHTASSIVIRLGWEATIAIYILSKIAHKSNAVDHWIFPFIRIPSLMLGHSFIYFFTSYYYPSFCEVAKNGNFVVKSSPTSAPHWIQISSFSFAKCVQKSPSVRLIACVS